ncbi:hypothetical protein PQX77_005224 [Marasmius sp. AFHP31]|nr:hypothetical protein PQX77_005224 [Marasmius sp. AFHP31]
MSPESKYELGVALVTGAGQGIGAAIAIQLAKDGFDVAVNDIEHNHDRVAAVSEEIKALGRSSSVHIADVSIEAEVETMIENVVKEHKSLDAMIANAGIAKRGPIIDTTVEDWDRIFAVNVRGTFLCYKHAGKQMIAQGRGGRIVGAASVAAKFGGPDLAAYAGTKFAVRGITQSTAKEFGPHGITVNAYAPGVIETSMMDYLSSEYAKSSGVTAEAFMKQANIADLVSYLVSKKASFMTGQSRDDMLYLDTIIFQVEETIFKVPSRYFPEKSEVFAGGAQISAETSGTDGCEGSCDANPVKLSPLPHECTADDFRCFVRIVAALTIGLPIPTEFSLVQWLAVLKLSTGWCFSEIRELAMKRVTETQGSAFGKDQWIVLLDFCQDRDHFKDLRDLTIKRISAYGDTSSLSKVLMGRKYRCETWIVQGLTELANSDNLPPLNELKVLGADTVATILYMTYEGYRDNQYGYGYGRRFYIAERDTREKFKEEIATYRYDL